MISYDDWANELRKNLSIESFFDLTTEHTTIKMDIFAKDSNGFFYKMPTEILLELNERIYILLSDYENFLDGKTKRTRKEKEDLQLTQKIIRMRIEKKFTRELKINNRKFKSKIKNGKWNPNICR